MEDGNFEGRDERKIAIIDLCKFKLHSKEFVEPVAEIIRKYGNFEIIKPEEFCNNSEKVIMCGTALKDNYYLKNHKKFSWLKNFDGKFLGICAGMHILGILNNAKIFKCVEIGKTKIEVIKKNWLAKKSRFEVYSLHNFALRDTNSFEIIAKSQKCAHIVKLKNKEQYGVLFHPEVLNKDVLENFALL